MPEDKVSAKIRADAEKRASEIKASFNEQKTRLAGEFEAQKKAYRDETARLVKVEEERISREILSEARLEARKRLLLAKHETIRNCLELATKELTNSKDYPELLDRIVKAALADASADASGDAEIFLSDNDRSRLTYSWAKKATGAKIQGGVILHAQSKDSNFSIDATYEALGENLTLELAKILFS